MVGKAIAIMIVMIAMTGQAVAATPAVAANGIASNRTALALGQNASGGGTTPTQSDVSGTDSSGSHTATLLIALGALAAIGLGVAAAAGGGNHPPVSP
jgi:hypothetical protein